MADGNVLRRDGDRNGQAGALGQPDEIANALLAFINTSIMAPDHSVQPHEDLERAGVDSMALLKILLFIQAEFGFWMPDEDLVAEHTATAQALANYICRRRQQFST
jgi:acyl carrier protein